MEDKQNTQEDSVDYKKRYKDIQGEYTKTKQEMADINAKFTTLTSSYARDKELLDGIVASGWTPQSNVQEEDPDKYLQSKDLSAIKQEMDALKRNVAVSDTRRNFRETYKDMADYEDFVAVEYEKTDKYLPHEQRISAAVELVKGKLTSYSERVTESETAQQKANAAKLAESEGLGGSKTPEAPLKEETGESTSDYITMRKNRLMKMQGIKT